MILLKQFILISLISLNLFASAQSNKEKATDYYSKGIKLYDNKKYKDAESWFSKSIDMFPQQNTYYHLALTKLILGDTCSYCKNLINTSKLGDQNAQNLYDSKCIIIKKVDFKNKLNSDTSYYANFHVSRCSNKLVRAQYFKKNLKNNNISTYNYTSKDTSDFNLKIYQSNFPQFSNVITETVVKKENGPVFTVVENMPSFPGGDEARIRFLIENITYPDTAKKNHIQGTIYITFVIDTDGSIENVKVLRGIGGGCDEEAVRVVQMMPKWTPGTQSGKPVRVQFYMPVKFTLN